MEDSIRSLEKKRVDVSCGMLFVILISLISTLLFSPGIINGLEKESPEISHEGGYLKIACKELVTTLDPQRAELQSEKWIIEQIFDGLFEYDTDDNIIPILAEDYPKRRGDYEYIVQLKANIEFHDRTPLDANDVVYTLKRLLDPATQCPTRHLFQNIMSAEAVSDRTIKFTVGPDCPDFLDLLTRLEMRPIPMHIVKRHGNLFGKTFVFGTGPFRFLEWDREKEIILERNYSYKLGRAYLHRIIFSMPKPEKDPARELLYARMELLPDVSQKIAEKLASRKGIRIDSKAGQRICQIYLNADHPPFDNQNIRNAVSLGINQEVILERVFNGYASAATSCIPPWHRFFDQEIKGQHYDPNLAESLLTFEGFTPDHPLSFSLMYSDIEPFKAIARILQEQLWLVNIRVHLIPLPKDVLFDYVYGRDNKDRYQFQAALEDWEDWRGGGNVEQFTLRLYHHQSPENKLGNSVYGWENELDLALRECKDKDREFLLRRAITHIDYDVVSIYLCYPHRIWAARSWVNGKFCNSLGNLFLERVWVR